MLAAALLGCGDGIPTEEVAADEVEAALVSTSVAPRDGAPGFADQAGGGIFVAESGAAVRLRLDGSPGPLESHPGNSVAPGAIAAALPFGAHAALAVAQNGAYVVSSGWLISPGWSEALAPAAIRAAAQSADGSIWLAHERGVYRVEGGALDELQQDGAPLGAVDAIAAGPVRDGVDGMWILRGVELSSIAPSTGGGWEVAVSPFDDPVRAVVGLTAGASGGAELWALEERTLLRRVGGSLRRYDFGEDPHQLVGAGRAVWARVGERVFRFDADEERWESLAGVAASDLVAADPSGAVWIRRDGALVCASAGAVPRLVGLDQNGRVDSDQLLVRAVFPGDPQPSSVTFALDDGRSVQAAPPLFSMGGVDAAGAPQPYSLAGLSEGRHALTATALLPGGGVAKRVAPFEYRPLEPAPPSFALDIAPIRDARCAKCHVGGAARDLSGFAQWVENAAAISRAVGERRMPADGPLEQSSIVKIQRWVQTGALP